MTLRCYLCWLSGCLITFGGSKVGRADKAIVCHNYQKSSSRMEATVVREWVPPSSSLCNPETLPRSKGPASRGALMSFPTSLLHAHSVPASWSPQCSSHMPGRLIPTDVFMTPFPSPLSLIFSVKSSLTLHKPELSPYLPALEGPHPHFSLLPLFLLTLWLSSILIIHWFSMLTVSFLTLKCNTPWMHGCFGVLCST